MQKPSSIPPDGKSARHFSRHYHRSSEIKSKISSKGRRFIELERQRRRSRLIKVFTIGAILGGIAIILQGIEAKWF
ncbi:MAG: hypothetical protein NWT08_09755 [Akkermansiaceae bacterium]|jgi:hypothetical protein|nr:hypothetical protein [Akkermansiaceae bacterium]MDP4645936.1 hypothetical protein [Akkermansiaceae bacterium]MDP4722410.1 hypothetical protein [Akkermansiaceae bacterium]MDP4781145.1 hypothetical protein [Akkermansiaceae bacterium]MDP4848129.1 hypothetical protein [Akkermansiaceae bacterium]